MLKALGAVIAALPGVSLLVKGAGAPAGLEATFGTTALVLGVLAWLIIVRSRVSERKGVHRVLFAIFCIIAAGALLAGYGLIRETRVLVYPFKSVNGDTLTIAERTVVFPLFPGPILATEVAKNGGLAEVLERGLTQTRIDIIARDGMWRVWLTELCMILLYAATAPLLVVAFLSLAPESELAAGRSDE